MSVVHIEPQRNPFSTAFVRPGTLTYLFADGASASSLIDKLEKHSWWGQITGPHGSGKSTLLHGLLPILREQREVAWFTLSSGQRRLPASPTDRLRWSNSTLVVVDGYEQLSRWQRARLRSQCRRLGCGLLVTSHADAGLPTVFTTATCSETTQQLVRILLAKSGLKLSKDQIEDAFEACDGNVRETFFELYDLCELQRLKRK